MTHTDICEQKEKGMQSVLLSPNRCCDNTFCCVTPGLSALLDVAFLSSPFVSSPLWKKAKKLLIIDLERDEITILGSLLRQNPTESNGF